MRGLFIRNHRSTVFLGVLLMILSVCSLFVGVLDIRPSDLFTGSVKTWEIFLISLTKREILRESYPSTISRFFVCPKRRTYEPEK